MKEVEEIAISMRWEAMKCYCRYMANLDRRWSLLRIDYDMDDETWNDIQVEMQRRRHEMREVTTRRLRVLHHKHGRSLECTGRLPSCTDY